MTPGADAAIPMSATGFAACWSAANALVNPDARLPDRPFTAPTGHVALAQYGHLLADEFALVLRSLALAHGDDDVSLVVVEPTPSYYLQHYEFHPGFRVSTEALVSQYWECLSYEPSGDPTGAIAYTANVVVVVGSTGDWAVWGQRDWDLVLVHASRRGGPWLAVGVPFVPAALALQDFTDAERGNDRLTESDRARFFANFGAR